jgi:hypothetical protein
VGGPGVFGGRCFGLGRGEFIGIGGRGRGGALVIGPAVPEL